MGLLDIFTFANTSTDNLFGMLAVASLYLIILINSWVNTQDANNSFITSGIITTFVAIFMLLVDLIVMRTFIITLTVTLISIIWSIFKK